MRFCLPKSNQFSYLLIIWLVTAPYATAADDYSFDISSFEKSPYEFWGYAEMRWEHIRFDKNSALYQLNYFDAEQLEFNNRYHESIQLEGRYRQNQLSAYARLNPEVYNDSFGNDATLTTHEAYLSWKVKTGMVVDAGKKLIKWGKGYAWNPVGFIERPKDPNDVDLAREGFTVIAGDLIFSNVGDFQTISITPVFLPVTSVVNNDFGPKDNNFAAKLYLLYKDTDIDFMFLSSGSRSTRYGFDFAKNISTHIEIHSEWAYITNVKQVLLDSTANVSINERDISNWLLGLRYLTQSDTTYIVEYYHNGNGFTEEQARRFYELVENVPNQPNTDIAINNARSIAALGYVKQSSMQNYLYLRIMQKEPFELLYFSPAVTAIINIKDKSYNLAPEAIYTGIDDLELRFRLNYLDGKKYSEFKEKPNDFKFEFRLRYHF